MLTKKVKVSFVLVFVLMLIGPGHLRAAETAALSTDYTDRVPARLGHGLLNTAFGWTELGFAPYYASQNGAGSGDVFARALTQPFATTFLGLWDLVTFWVPGETGRSMAVPRYVGMGNQKTENASAKAQPAVEMNETSEPSGITEAS